MSQFYSFTFFADHQKKIKLNKIYFPFMVQMKHFSSLIFVTAFAPMNLNNWADFKFCPC